METLDTFLPYGPTLKPLISHSTMSDADLRDFLNSKGIFLSDYSRDKVVPILEVSLITPKDYFSLREKNKSKEDKVKRITKKIKINKNFSLVDILSKYKFDAEENSNFQNYSFIDKPEITEEKSSCIMEYKIKRFDKFKSWTEHETEHNGRVVFKIKDKYLEVEAFSEHTAIETKKINETIISDVKKFLTDKQLVNAGEEIAFIKYDDFNNEERIEFLLLFRNITNSNIQLVNVADVVFAPDDMIDISKTELSWMKDKVKKLILLGKSLDQIIYLKKEDNFKYIIIETIVLKYNYKLLNFTGDASIEVGFPNIINRRDPMKEFQFQINTISVNEDTGKSALKRIEKEIASIINDEKEAFYNSILKKRK